MAGGAAGRSPALGLVPCVATLQRHACNCLNCLVLRIATHYTSGVIRGFRHKGLRRLYTTGSTQGIDPSHARRLRRILASLDAATEPRELDLPGYRLHALKGNMKGRWSITVSGNWRVTFIFTGTDVDQIDYMDYH